MGIAQFFCSHALIIYKAKMTTRPIQFQKKCTWYGKTQIIMKIATITRYFR